MSTTFTVDGRTVTVTSPPDTPLLWVLRDELGLTGTKFGCGRALCGACTLHVDGEAVRACVHPVGYAAGKDVRTIATLEESAEGRAVVDAWIATEVVQCGWCQPGQCMSAASLLARKPTPDDEDIDAAMSGNLCRCGTYTRIRAAIHEAARALDGEADG